MVGIRNSIKAEAESLNELVNRVTSEKLEQADKIEESLLKALASQKKTTYDKYIVDLDYFDQQFHNYMSSTNVRDFFSDQFAYLKIEPTNPSIIY